MGNKQGIRVLAIIETFIGLTTLIAVSLSLIQGKSSKPLEVLIFVLVAALISTGLGFGIFKCNLNAYRLLLYFSSTIILSKILIFAKIITLNGALETTVPSDIKNIISVLYHSILVFYFTRKSIREQFDKQH